MYCFTHEGIAAIGVCGQCGKGVCRGCTVVDLGFMLACSQSCATLARNSHALELSVERVWGVGGQKPKLTATVLIFALLGLIFLCFALYNTLVEERTDWFGVVVGSAFIAVALLSHRRKVA